MLPACWQLPQTGGQALDIANFDLRALPPGFHGNPYPFYRALREQTPMRPMRDGSWLLTRLIQSEGDDRLSAEELL